MTSTADVIVLSSSPSPPRSPGPGRNVANQVSNNSPRGATPPPAPSTSGLSKPPTRSRFFPTPIASVSCTKDATKAKKRSTKKDSASNGSDQTAPSKPRRKAKKSAEAPEIPAPEESLQNSVGTQNDAVKPTKARARKNAKNKDSGNMTLAGKVTKTGDPPAKKPSKGGKKAATSKLSPPEGLPNESTSIQSNSLGKGETLHLDEAMRRRMDWTPPPDTHREVISVIDDTDSQETTRDSNLIGGFGKLLSDYNYSGSALNPRDFFQNSNDGGPTKRRRIELVDPEIQALLNGRYSGASDQTSAQGENMASSAKSKKATKVKPRKFTTLTARMTAQYAKDDAEEEESVIECVPDIRTAKSRRGKAKETEKESPFTVLSPEAAVEFLNDQDHMFGTCSQLEREDSPQTLREIQQAIRASETLSYPKETCKEGSASMQETSTRSISRMAGSRNLWCVGARDSEGSLIQSETLRMVDLTDGRESPIQKSYKDMKSPSHKALQKDWFELEFADIDSPPEKRPLLPLTKEDSGSDTIVTIPAPAPEAAAAATSKPTVPKPAKGTKIPSEPTVSQPSASQAPSMPHYTGFTDSELSKQISTYGFKAVRGRKKMIDLLQQCWESKHGTDAASDSQSVHQSDQQKEAVSEKCNDPKSISDVKAKAKAKMKTTVKSKPKTSTKNKNPLDTTKSAISSQTNLETSPQKSSQGKSITEVSASFIDIEEIQDSEEEIIPSPSQVQKHYTDIYSKSKTKSKMQHHSLDILTKSPPPSPTKRKVVSSKISVKRPLSSASATTTRTAESKQFSLAEISAQITEAVRIQSRLSPLSSRGSRTRPTWHEKILMYDPIVLEDFTAWLNTEGLGLVGEDCEVGTVTVREWCESKGICCCWKKNASW